MNSHIPIARERQYRQQGISLIELMISLTLSALLMLGVMKMFADSTTNSLADTALSQVQDSGRIAMEILKRDIRMAGFQGGISRLQKTIENSLVDLSDKSIVEIVEGGNTATLNDQLKIRSAFDTGSKITDFYDTNQKLSLASPICIKNTDNIFVTTDGQNVASFKSLDAASCATNSALDTITPIGQGNNPVSLQNFSLPGTCGASSATDNPTINLDNCPSLYRFDSLDGSLYSIQFRQNAEGNNVLGSDNQPISALFLNGEEMVEGVENLQVLYGIEASNGNIRYMKGCATPCTITNSGEKITHLKVSLVVASTFPVSPRSRQQSFSVLNLKQDHSNYTTNDRRLRRVFTSTIQLKNRG